MDTPASPSVTVTEDERASSAPSPVVASKTVRFQCGLLRETETFSEEDLEDVSLDAVLEYVVEMLNIKVSTRLLQCLCSTLACIDLYMYVCVDKVWCRPMGTAEVYCSSAVPACECVHLAHISAANYCQCAP